MLKAPFSSEFDPSEEAEGSIDPLGLAPAYERLADRLLPAVTVRMGRPRFVTAMALGACVCASWDTETVSTDSMSPPWQVYEWFVVEAFVRAAEVFKVAPVSPEFRKLDGRFGMVDQCAPLPISRLRRSSDFLGYFDVLLAKSGSLRMMGSSTTAAMSCLLHGPRIRGSMGS